MASRPVRILGSIFAGAILLTVWAVFAPTKLGGSTSYSITAGNSMEPLLHADDLALVRAEAEYEVGDIVLFESPVLHKPVLHRIILIDGDDYFFKGDNNGFVDPGSASRDDLVGTMWFSVPSVGVVMGWFGEPSHAALLGGFATVVVVLTSVNTRNTGRRRRREGSPA